MHLSITLLLMLGTQLILLYSDILTVFVVEKSDVFNTSLLFPSFQDFNKHFAQDTKSFDSY